MADGSEYILLFEIGLILCIASIASELFKKMRLPGLIGAILVGFFIGGPGGLGWVTDINQINILATLGAVLLLFGSGLELDPNAFLKAGKKAFLLTTFGVVFSVLVGFGIGLALNLPQQAAFLLGVIISPSSTSIIAAVLMSERKTGSDAGTTLLTSAVVDDIEGILLLSIALSDWGDGGFSPWSLVWSTIIAVVFIFGAIFLGKSLFPRLVEKMESRFSEEVLFAILLGLGLIVAFCATLVGLAAITGGFIVGVLIPYKKVGEKMDQRISMMKNIFAILFFTSIGLSIDPGAILGVLPLMLLILVAAIATRLGGGLLGGRIGGQKGKDLWFMTSGLSIRGEVSLIIAQAGIALGIIGPEFLIIAAGVVIGSIVVMLPIYQKLIKTAADPTPPLSPSPALECEGNNVANNENKE